MRYAIVIVAAIVLSVLGLGFRLFLSSSEETTPQPVNCGSRKVVLASETLGREVLDTGDFGPYVLSPAFVVEAQHVVEAVLIDNHQGGIFVGFNPSVLLVVDGNEPDRRSDPRFPSFDDDGTTRLLVPPGSYRAYTTSNAATVDIAVCSND